MAKITYKKYSKDDQRLLARDVPGGEYAVAECTLATISTTWQRLFRE